MALSDILKKYGGTTGIEGIMTPSTSTTQQQVYNSSTNSISTVQGVKYTGPTATIAYGTAEKGYPRMLREIEQGELPQFDQTQFAKKGTGKVEIPTYEATTTTTTPTVETKADAIVNPCPAGYQLVNGVCQPIQQDRGRDRPTYTGPEISDAGVIEGYTGVLGRDRPTAGRYEAISEKYGKAVADKVFEVNRTYRNRGAQLKAIDEAEKNRILSVYGQDRLNKDYVLGKNDKGEDTYYRVVATSPTLGELATDMGIAMGEILQNFNTINLINIVLGKRELTKDEVATDSTLVKLGIQKPSKLLKSTNRREYNKQLREYNIDKLKTANAVNYYGNSEEVTNEIANRIKQAEAEKPDRPAQNLQEAQKEADRQARASGFKNQKDQARARERQATTAQKGLGPQTTSEGRAFGRI